MTPINYTRLNMNDIRPEIRRIAVAWVEGFEKIGGMEIEQKVKLASDIQNYSDQYLSSYKQALERAIDEEIGKLKYFEPSSLINVNSIEMVNNNTNSKNFYRGELKGLQRAKELLNTIKLKHYEN